MVCFLRQAKTSLHVNAYENLFLFATCLICYHLIKTFICITDWTTLFFYVIMKLLPDSYLVVRR